MLKKIKLSVIVPIYKVENYLNQALQSLMDQTYEHIEFILIDNGCYNDNCSRIIQEFALKNKKVIVYRFEKNVGYGAACNKGLEIATGNYITIFEPDDWIEKNMYEILVNKIREDIDIIKCDFNNVYKEETVKNIISSNFFIDNKVFKISQNPILLFVHPSIWTCIYKKEFLTKNNIKFIESAGASWQDNPFQMQTMCLANKILFIPKGLYNYRRKSHKETDELKNWRYPFDRIKDIDKWIKQNKINNKNILACYYKRNLSYIKTAIKVFKLNEYREFVHIVKEVVANMDLATIKSNEFITKKEKNFFNHLSNISLYKLLNLRWFDGSFRRWAMSIHLKKNGFIQLVGFQFYWGNLNDVKSIIKIRIF